MRPIKFRAWDVEGKCWIPDTHICISATGMILTWDEWKKQWIEETIKIIIFWYTGLLDKNRAKIFEGDICRCIHSEQNGKNPFEKIEQVYTRPGGFSLFGKPMQDFSYESNNRLTAFNWKTDRSINIPEFYYKIYDIEVIGNIWEHPTLLAEKGGENEAK